MERQFFSDTFSFLEKNKKINLRESFEKQPQTLTKRNVGKEMIDIDKNNPGRYLIQVLFFFQINKTVVASYLWYTLI